MKPYESDLAVYLSENYGHCNLGSDKCYHGPGPQCLSRMWRGTGCPHWKPTTARNWEELAVEMRKLYDKSGTEEN